MHAKIKYTESLLIRSLICMKKLTSFCQVLKEMHTKEIGSFF